MHRLYSVLAIVRCGDIGARNVSSMQSRVIGAESSTKTTKHSNTIPTVEAAKDWFAEEKHKDISSSNNAIPFVPQTQRSNIERDVDNSMPDSSS